MLQVGQITPSFSLEDDQGRLISLDSFPGQSLILYFYPKDNTSGCTQEACDFQDNISLFEKINVPIIGVSRDSVESHKKFKAKYNLSFSLLSDPEGTVCKAYGVWVEKSMYGKKYFGIERTTFLISEDRKIVKIWSKVKVKDHVKDVLASL